MNPKKAYTEYAKPKPYEELQFTDDFMFCRVLQSTPELCRELVSLILGKEVKRFLQTEPQKAVEITADGRGVRFDVFLEDDEETVYDISNEIKEFLRYLTMQETRSEFTRRLDAAVREAREEKRWRMEYMTLLERDEIMKEAGRAEGLIHGRLSLLYELVDSHVLSLREAAGKAGMSEEEFRNAMERAESQ